MREHTSEDCGHFPAMPESKVSVSVEEMVASIKFARSTVRGDVNTSMRQIVRLNAASNYILTAQSTIAERDAEIAELKLSWVPQDVAMECREMLLAAGFGKPGTGNTLHGMVQQACALIAEMRKVTGPKCPKCEHWLKAEHCARDESGLVGSDAAATQFVCWIGDGEHEAICTCEITSVDLLANHPDIAAELGLTKEPSNAD